MLCRGYEGLHAAPLVALEMRERHVRLEMRPALRERDQMIKRRLGSGDATMAQMTTPLIAFSDVKQVDGFNGDVALTRSTDHSVDAGLARGPFGVFGAPAAISLRVGIWMGLTPRLTDSICALSIRCMPLSGLGAALLPKVPVNTTPLADFSAHFVSVAPIPLSTHGQISLSIFGVDETTGVDDRQAYGAMSRIIQAVACPEFVAISPTVSRSLNCDLVMLGVLSHTFGSATVFSMQGIPRRVIGSFARRATMASGEMRETRSRRFHRLVAPAGTGNQDRKRHHTRMIPHRRRGVTASSGTHGGRI